MNKEIIDPEDTYGFMLNLHCEDLYVEVFVKQFREVIDKISEKRTIYIENYEDEAWHYRVYSTLDEDGNKDEIGFIFYVNENDIHL